MPLSNRLFPELEYSPAFSRFRSLWGYLEGSDPIQSVLGDLSHCTLETSETDTHITVALPLPGFKREQITLQVAHETSESVEVTMVGVRANRKLERTVVIGHTDCPVDPASVTAKLEDGVLSITATKRATPKPRQIPIA